MAAVTVSEQALADGRRLFQARSIVPVVLLPIVILALPTSAAVAARIGDSACTEVQWLSLSVALLGLVVRCATVAFAPDGTSSRDTRALRAPLLNTTGPYSVVRHPLYLGAGLIWVGIAMSLGVWWLVVIVAMAYWLYAERLMLAEEQFLADTFGDTFLTWAARTHAVVPRPGNWQPAVGPLQLKRLSSEHNGLLTIGIAFPLLQYLVNLFGPGLSWQAWSARHTSLTHLFAVTAAISVSCILLRRLPPPSTAARESNVGSRN